MNGKAMKLKPGDKLRQIPHPAAAPVEFQIAEWLARRSAEFHAHQSNIRLNQSADSLNQVGPLALLIEQGQHVLGDLRAARIRERFRAL